MKNKRIVFAILIAVAIMIIILFIIAFIIWGLPRNMGPIEPFLNFSDLLDIGIYRLAPAFADTWHFDMTGGFMRILLTA